MSGYVQNSTTSPTAHWMTPNLNWWWLTAPRKQILAIQQVRCYGSKCAKVKQQKEKPVNTSSTQKSLLGLKLDYFQELEWETVEFVHLKRNSGMPVTYKPIKYKAWELVESHNIKQHYFSDSAGWCVHSMQRNRFTVCRRTSLSIHCQQTRRRLLLFSTMWLDFIKRTVIVWTKGEMPMKHHCILMCHPIVMSVAGQNLWWFNYQVVKRCM